MQKKVTWRTWLGAFVPQHISNRIVCRVMGLLGVLCRTSKKKREENRAQNIKVLDTETVFESVETASQIEESPWPVPGAYVENQPQWEAVRYGKRSTMSYSGCEILAVYNARIALGECLNRLDLVEIINDFEKTGAVWAGLLGSAPGAICKYFRKRGYEVDVWYRREESIVNRLGNQYDTVIAMFYNDAHNIFKMIHTVNISKDETGKYWVHNCYKRRNAMYVSDGPYDSVWSAIHNEEARERAVLCVIGIRKNYCIGEEKRV